MGTGTGEDGEGVGAGRIEGRDNERDFRNFTNVFRINKLLQNSEYMIGRKDVKR